MGGKSKQNSSSSGQNVSSGVGVNYGVNQSGQTAQSSSGSQGSSVNQSSQSVWGDQSPYLQDVYSSAQGQYGQTMDDINALQPQVQGQVSDAYNQASGGYGNQMAGGFAQGLQGQVGQNAYVDALAGDMMSDAQKIKQQNLGGLDARAAASGMSGSSGYRNQVGNMMNDVDEKTLQGMNQLRFNSFNQGVQNNMNVAGMMDRNQQGAMANVGNMQQGAMNQFNPTMAGMNATGMYGQMIGGPTVLGQSSGSSQQSASSQGSSNGFSNGMNVGMNMSGGQGFNNSTGSGSSWNVSPPSFSFAG